MDIVYLDANVLFSASYKSNARVRALWSVAQVRLLTSAYAIEEARLNLTSIEQREALSALLASVVRCLDCGDHPLMHSVELAVKDRPILASALSAEATHLLTGDVAHFGHLLGTTVGSLLILRPADYLRSKENGSPRM